MTHPAAVTACNLDLENLITDSNRSIATLAITTLLKTGSETSVDRLMKQIATFVNEISDEFKVNILIFYTTFNFSLQFQVFVCFKRFFFLKQLSSKGYLNLKFFFKQSNSHNKPAYYHFCHVDRKENLDLILHWFF